MKSWGRQEADEKIEMSKPKLNRAIRRAIKGIRLGKDAECEECGERDILTLQLAGGHILCAECRLTQSGKSGVERHHPPGRRNDPFAVPLPANDHAILSDAQQDWPSETLKNQRRDALHRQAAWLRAIHDTRQHMADSSLPWAIELETLATYLTEKLGKRWWHDFIKWRKERD